MTIVVYPDVIVPSNVIKAGASGRQTRQNLRTTNQGGFASVNAIRDVTLREFSLGVKPMSLDAWAQIEAMYEVTDAGTFGMLLADPKDSVVTSSQGALIGYMTGVENGVYGFGNGTPLYGLRKLYVSGSRAKARAITRPNSTPALLRNGSAVTVGVAAGNVSLSAAPRLCHLRRGCLGEREQRDGRRDHSGGARLRAVRLGHHDREAVAPRPDRR